MLIFCIYIHISYRHAYISINLDIDECSNDTDGCSQLCTNTNGSFICRCNRGFVLDVDGATCNGMQFVSFIHTYNTSNLMCILRYNYSYNKYTLCIIILVTH